MSTFKCSFFLLMMENIRSKYWTGFVLQIWFFLNQRKFFQNVFDVYFYIFTIFDRDPPRPDLYCCWVGRGRGGCWNSSETIWKGYKSPPAQARTQGARELTWTGGWLLDLYQTFTIICSLAGICEWQINLCPVVHHAWAIKTTIYQIIFVKWRQFTKLLMKHILSDVLGI